MSIKLFIYTILFISSCNSELYSQISFTDSVEFRTEMSRNFKPIPRYSALWGIIPAGGQLYNRDFYKVPIVLTAMIISVGTIVTNETKYKAYLASYFQLYDLRKYIEFGPSGKSIVNPNFGKQLSDTATVRVYNWLTTSYREIEGVTIDQIRRNKSSWRRYKNLSIIATAAAYSLSIIEANVAGHLKSFDISEDLTLKIYPNVSQPFFLSKPIIGVNLTLNIK